MLSLLQQTVRQLSHVIKTWQKHSHLLSSIQTVQNTKGERSISKNNILLLCLQPLYMTQAMLHFSSSQSWQLLKGH
jgi:hypothetical protein